MKLFFKINNLSIKYQNTTQLITAIKCIYEKQRPMPLTIPNNMKYFKSFLFSKKMRKKINIDSIEKKLASQWLDQKIRVSFV